MYNIYIYEYNTVILSSTSMQHERCSEVFQKENWLGAEVSQNDAKQSDLGSETLGYPSLKPSPSYEQLCYSRWLDI